MKNIFLLYIESIRESKINWLNSFATFLIIIAVCLNANKNFSIIYLFPLIPFVITVGLYIYIATQIRKNCLRNAVSSDKEKLSQGYLWFASYKNYFFNKEYPKTINESILFPSMSILFFHGMSHYFVEPGTINFYGGAVILLTLLMNASSIMSIITLSIKALRLGRIDENKTPNDYFNFAINNPQQEKRNFEKLIDKQHLLKVNSEKASLVQNKEIISGKTKQIKRL